MHSERNAGSRFTISLLSLPSRAFFHLFHVFYIVDDDVAAGYFVAVISGYVLLIIDAPDDRSCKRRELGLHEMH